MAMRFYLNETLSPGEIVSLKEIEHHHLSHVLRVHEQEEVLLVNGKGSLAHAIVLKIAKGQTTIRIESCEQKKKENLSISMAIPMMRPSKLEWVIEKVTELGADQIYIYQADHSKPSQLTDHQIGRLRAITISALKQSQRLFLPTLEVIADLQSTLSTDREILFCDPHSDTPISSKRDQAIIVVTGPESGFSDVEIKTLSEVGKGVKINPYILRAETAPIAALSILKSK